MSSQPPVLRMAEEVKFELTELLHSAVFKTHWL